MEAVLANEVGKLVDWGWGLESQTTTTASLQTRGPFNWLVFAILVLLFPFIGGLFYIAFWLISSRLTLFLRVDNGALVYAGDSWFVERQAAQAEASRQLAIRIKSQGFWKTMAPSIIAALIGIAVWVVLFWALFKLLD